MIEVVYVNGERREVGFRNRQEGMAWTMSMQFPYEYLALWDENGELNEGYVEVYHSLTDDSTEDEVVSKCIKSGLVSLELAHTHPLWEPILARLGLNR